MLPLPIVDWEAALAEMESALGATLAALDRYQAGWEHLLAERATAASTEAARPLDRLEDRLHEWDARLRAAAELTESVDRELNDRGAALSRWQDSFAAWREGIQRGVELESPS